MPLADLSLKNNDTTVVGTLRYLDIGDGKIVAVSALLDSTGALVTSANPLPVGDAGGSLTVDVGTALPAGNNNIGDVDIASIAAGTNNIGDVDVLSVPADPFGVNADAASATGSISAKLRHLAAVGLAGMTSLPAGTNNIGDVDVLSVPADPFGANADAAATAGGTGSIQAKLRLMTSQLGSLVTQTDGVEALLAAGLPAALVGGRLDVNVGNNPVLGAGTSNIGDVDVLTVPADPFGVNADAASATGSISAKLRHLAATGIAGMTSLPAGTNNIGDVDVLTVPADPFGVNADAASATGSISAKLRHLAATGIAGMTSLPAGTNNIGDVDVLSLPALAAGTNLIGKAAVAPDAKVQYDGTTSLTVKYANIDTATSGNNAIVAAVASKKIKVISVFLAASGAVDVYFNDGTANLLGGTRKIKLDNTGATGAGGFALQHNATGWFETAAVNRALNLNLSAAVGVAGCLAYVEVDA